MNMNSIDALRLVLEAAEKHADRLQEGFDSLSYHEDLTEESIYREAIEKVREDLLNVHQTR